MATVAGLNSILKTGLLAGLGSSLKSSKKPYIIGGLGALGMSVPFTRNLILNEMLGVDDFRRAAKYANEGEFSILGCAPKVIDTKHLIKYKITGKRN